MTEEQVQDQQEIEDTQEEPEGSEDTTAEQVEVTEEKPLVDPKAFEDLRKKVETLTNAENRAKKNPTDSNVKAAEQQKLKLAEFVEKNEFADEGLRAVAEDLKAIYSKTDTTESEVKGELKTLKEEIASLRVERDRVVFDRQYPDLAGKYDDVMTKVRDAAEKDVARIGGHELVSDPHWNDIVQRHLENVTKSMLSGKQEPEKGKQPAQTKIAAGRSTAKVPKRDWRKEFPTPPKF